MTEDIRHFKLITGDDIVGDLIQATETFFVIDNPLVMDEWMDTKSGQSGIVLNKYCPFSTDNFVEVQRANVVTHYPVHEVVRGYYYTSLRMTEKYTERLLEQLAGISKSYDFLDLEDGSYVHKGTETPH